MWRLLSIVGLIGSCITVSLLAVVILIRWPFVLGAWLLKQVGDALAELTIFLENL